MPLINKDTLLKSISPPADEALTRVLLDEFISLEKRFIQGDWSPAELDGGQFAEVLARIIYHLDSTILNLNKGFDECISYIEDNSNKHHYSDRKSLIHISKA